MTLETVREARPDPKDRLEEPATESVDSAVAPPAG